MDITVTREELVEIIEAAFDLGYKKGTKVQECYKIKDSNGIGTFSSIQTNGLTSTITQTNKKNAPQTYTTPQKPYGMEFKYNGTER